METTRTQQRESSSGSALGPVFGAAPRAPARGILVTCGIYHSNVAAGMTVGDIRAQMTTPLDLDPGSRALVDGQEVDDAYVVPESCLRVSFLKRAGEKGAGCGAART
jgi:hypothetical protein